MKKKPKPLEQGDKLIYKGRGFINYDPAQPEMIFICKDGIADYRVTYRGNEMLVRDYEVDRA